jgi:8-oxo-dGTP diphosphatase|tara:strand:+ start:1377 stop:2129 length:753 start_codon:yes stop_codon:yes gene_type:complete
MAKTKQATTENVLGHQFSAYYKISMDKFFQFALSVDCVILGYDKGSLRLLLIERGARPHQGKMALPGDLVYPSEDMELAASRVLSELTGLEGMFMTQFHSYGQVDRHPVGRVVTVGYYTLISVDKYQPLASSWADNVSWVDVNKLPDLAFDHNNIVKESLVALRERVRLQPIGFKLLPKEFTLGQMQHLYETILEEKFDKANFRKKIISMGLLKETGKRQKDVSHRPAKLYSFEKDKYESLLKKGFTFEL